MALPMPRLMGQLLHALASQSGQAGGQVVFALLTTRWLPPQQRGSLILVLALASTLAVVGNGGLGIEARRLIADEGAEGGNKVLAGGRVAALVCLSVTVIVGLPVLAFAGVPITPVTALLLVLISQSQASLYLSRSGLYALDRFGVVTWTTGPASVLQIVGVLVLQGMGLLSFASAAVLWLAISAANALILLIAFRKATGSTGSRSSAWDAYRKSLPAMPGVLGQSYVNGADRMLLGFVSDPATVAVYGAGRSLATLPMLVSNAASQISLNRGARDLGRSMGRFESASIILSAAMCLVLALLAPWLVPWLFGQQYSSAVVVTQIFMGTAFLMTIQVLQRALSQGQGQHRRVGRNLLIGAVTMTVLVPLFGAWEGAAGAAWAMLVVAAVLAGSWAVSGRREVGG